MTARSRGKPSRADQFGSAVNWEPTFWATVGTVFPQLLTSVTADGALESAVAWAQVLRSAANAALDHALRAAGYGPSARIAVAKAEQGFRPALDGLLSTLTQGDIATHATA